VSLRVRLKLRVINKEMMQQQRKGCNLRLLRDKRTQKADQMMTFADGSSVLGDAA